MTSDVRRSLAALDDTALERALRDLGDVLAVPATPPMAAGVLARLESPLPKRRRPWAPDFRIRRIRRWALLAALIALLVLAGIAAAIGFGLPGLRI